MNLLAEQRVIIGYDDVSPISAPVVAEGAILVPMRWRRDGASVVLEFRVSCNPDEWVEVPYVPPKDWKREKRSHRSSQPE